MSNLDLMSELLFLLFYSIINDIITYIVYYMESFYDYRYKSRN